MKKQIGRVVLCSFAVLCLASLAHAAAWTPPNNVRIVQYPGGGGTNVYSNIDAALASIPTSGSSAPAQNNRYLIRVMPGEYNEVVNMKSFVDIEGSGAENTVITSSISNSGDCLYGTVNMSNDSAIRNIKVVNTATTGSEAGALAFDNVKAMAEGVSILSGSDSTAGVYRFNGVCVSGVSSNATLNNITVETHNGGTGQSNSIMMALGGKVTLTNSKLTGFGANAMVKGVNSGNSNATIGSVTIRNSTVNLTAGSRMEGIYLSDYILSIVDSSIFMNVGSGNSVNALDVRDATTTSVINTSITSDGTVTYYYDNPPRIANSLLQGGSVNLSGARLVNCYDENYDKIADQ